MDPPPCPAVFRPSGKGRMIGNAGMELTHTDVGIVQLHDAVEFTNKTFESFHNEANAMFLVHFS